MTQMTTTLKRSNFENSEKIHVSSISDLQVNREMRKIEEAMKEVKAMREGKIPKRDIHDFLNEL